MTWMANGWSDFADEAIGSGTVWISVSSSHGVIVALTVRGNDNFSQLSNACWR